MKLKASLATETYISDGGYYVIKQTIDGSDEPIIVLSPDQMVSLIDDMKSRLEDSAYWWKADDDTSA